MYLGIHCMLSHSSPKLNLLDQNVMDKIVPSILFCVSGPFFDSLDTVSPAQRLDAVFLGLNPSQLAPGGEGLGADERAAHQPPERAVLASPTDQVPDVAAVREDVSFFAVWSLRELLSRVSYDSLKLLMNALLTNIDEGYWWLGSQAAGDADSPTTTSAAKGARPPAARAVAMPQNGVLVISNPVARKLLLLVAQLSREHRVAVFFALLKHLTALPPPDNKAPAARCEQRVEQAAALLDVAHALLAAHPSSGSAPASASFFFTTANESVEQLVQLLRLSLQIAAQSLEPFKKEQELRVQRLVCDTLCTRLLIHNSITICVVVLIDLSTAIDSIFWYTLVSSH